MKALRFAIFLPVLGCAGGSMTVVATSFSEASFREGRPAPICFVPAADARGANADLRVKRLYERFSSICSTTAKRAGIQIVEHGSGPCLETTLSWSVGRGKSTFVGGSFCRGAMCTSDVEESRSYNKWMIVSLSEQLGGAPRRVHSVEIGSNTGKPGFSSLTAFGLCTGAFANYPREVENATLVVPLE